MAKVKLAGYVSLRVTDVSTNGRCHGFYSPASSLKQWLTAPVAEVLIPHMHLTLGNAGFM